MSTSFPVPAAPYTPRVIAEGERLFVPAGTQMLFADELIIEGEAVIEGDLVEVD
jgi:hypothetical protein